MNPGIGGFEVGIEKDFVFLEQTLNLHVQFRRRDGHIGQGGGLGVKLVDDCLVLV